MTGPEPEKYDGECEQKKGTATSVHDREASEGAPFYEDRAMTGSGMQGKIVRPDGGATIASDVAGAIGALMRAKLSATNSTDE